MLRWRVRSTVVLSLKYYNWLVWYYHFWLQEAQNKNRFWEQDGRSYYAPKKKETDPDKWVLNFTLNTKYSVLPDPDAGAGGQVCCVTSTDGVQQYVAADRWSTLAWHKLYCIAANCLFATRHGATRKNSWRMCPLFPGSFHPFPVACYRNTQSGKIFNSDGMQFISDLKKFSAMPCGLSSSDFL